MPRNGTGTYASPAGQPVTTGTVIDSVVFNNNTADVATALTNSLAKNGETTPTANLPMGGFKHTGVADATARTQYTSAAQVQDSLPTLITSISGTDTITGSPSIAVAAYVTGQEFRFIPANTNTGAVTINISGLGARNIVKGNAGAALAAGDLTAGVPVTITYNGTAFYMPFSPVDQSANYVWTGVHRWSSTASQSDARIGLRGRVNGLEFGHSNSAGYGSTIGYERASGRPFVAFNAEHGTNDNTFQTRGIVGKVIESNAAGALIIGTVPTASADNQSLVTDVTVASNGAVSLAGSLTVTGTVSGPGSGLTALNATNLASGTVPDARFPATLPAVSGVNLTNLNMGAAASGTLAVGRGGTGVTSLGTISRTDDTNVTLTLGGTPANSTIQNVSFTMGWTGQLAVARGGTGVSSLGNITRVDDTNVTLTLGGTPTGAVINSTSFTLGWTGVLSVARGGTGQSTFTPGYLEVPQNAQTGNYTLVLADSGKHIYHASGAGATDTYTIPANASVAYPIGTVLTFVNSDSNSVSIAITTDTMTLAGTTTTGTRTLAQNGVATAIKVTSTAWIISGTGLS